MQKRAQNLCHSAGVKFVCVQLDLDFADLNTIQGATNSVLWGKYYLQLPQTMVQLTNAVGNQYNLSTFHGPQDIPNLLMDEVQCQILNITHQDGPFELLAPAFNLSSCRTKSAGIYSKLKTMVVKLASPTISDQLFLVLLPGYLVEPHTVLDHIWQNYTNADGVQHRLGAQVYYTTFLNEIRSFYDPEEYPINIAGIFMAHIDPTYAKGFQSNFPDHRKIRSCMALNQHRILTDMLTALIKTKNKVSNIFDIVRVNQRGGEQFLTSSHHTASSTASFPCIAKLTLDRYSEEGASSTKLEDGMKLECFGCGSPHP